jgi:ketosteroid isomerase-like protein
MSQENVEIVRRTFDAFARGDIESLLPLLDPDVEIRSLMTEAERTIYRGHKAAREWFAAVLDVFPDWRPSPQQVRSFDDVVVVAFHVTATAAGSGIRIEQTYWHAARLRDGKVASFAFHRTEAEALAAVELSE